MPAHQSRNSIHPHNGRPGCRNDLTHTPVGPDSGQHKSKPGNTGPQACSCDRIGIPGWAPITEALAVARVGVVLVEINYCCLGASVS